MYLLAVDVLIAKKSNKEVRLTGEEHNNYNAKNFDRLCNAAITSP